MITPLGIFDIVHPFAAHRPPWAQFALLTEHDARIFADAAEYSRTTGFRWVLFLVTPDTTGASNAGLYARVRTQCDVAGLTPYLVSMCCGEEWYRALIAGELREPWGATDADRFAQITTIRRWLGQQHLDMKAAFPGLPVVWYDTFVNNDRRYGAYWWRPVPPHTDVVGIEAYTPAIGSFEADCLPFLEVALSTTPLPLVVIEQWWRNTQDVLWSKGPTEASVAGVRAWRHRAGGRVVARWAFSYPSRGGDFVGLDQMPEWHTAVVL